MFSSWRNEGRTAEKHQKASHYWIIIFLELLIIIIIHHNRMFLNNWHHCFIPASILNANFTKLTDLEFLSHSWWNSQLYHIFLIVVVQQVSATMNFSLPRLDTFWAPQQCSTILKIFLITSSTILGQKLLFG